MLTQQLRELEQSNIVHRKSYNQVPPKVEYALSEYGQTLSTVLDSLCEWGKLHVNTLQKQGQQIILLEEE
jgi:DNA-binding HxlR family transcriptional regulator